MPLGTGAKLLTHGKSCMLQNSENTALSTGWIPLISRAPFMQQSCFQGAAVKCIIKQSHQTHGFMTAEFPEANPLAKASSWYFQDTVCNQIQAGPTATPNHFNLTIFLLSAYSHLTLQVGSSSYKNSNFFLPQSFTTTLLHSSGQCINPLLLPQLPVLFLYFQDYLLHPRGGKKKPRII